MEQQLRYLALHDALTDLPNRVLLLEQMEQVLQATTSQKLGLFVLNLSRFKDINDTFGHHQGDLLLREVGKRLKQPLSAGEIAVRRGGDEFAIVLPEASEEQINQVALHAH